jgi:putative sterol carrier protein
MIMPVIYTTAWYEELKELLNHNPEVQKNAPPGSYNVLAEIKGEDQSPYLPEGDDRRFVVRLTDGKCDEYYETSEPPSRKEFDFIFDLSATVFEGVAAGVVDPVDAGLKVTIKITGDMRVLIRYADVVNVLYDVYSREVQTEWPKGRPPYGSNGS